MRERLASLRLIFSLAYRADPRLAIAAAVMIVLQGLSTPLFGWGLMHLIGAAVEGDMRGVRVGAVVLAFGLAVLLLLQEISTKVRVTLQHRTGVYLDREMMELTAGLPQIEHFERPEHADRLALVREGRRVLGHSGPGMLFESCAQVVSVVGLVVLLAGVDPLLLVLPLFALPSLIVRPRGELVVARGEEDAAADLRLANELFELTTQPGPAKEIRIFGTGATLRARHTDATLRADAVLGRAELRRGLREAIGDATFIAGFGLAIVYLAREALAGRATEADLLFVVFAAEQLNVEIGAASSVLGSLLRSLTAARRYAWLRSYSRRAPTEPTADVPAVIASQISFEHVSFRYPGSERPVLDDVSFSIPAGHAVALVGENGAGKSTLVKLLCRLYEPTSGRITLDGVDIRAFDVEAWRATLAAGFQDFCRFELLARETVGVGALARIDDVRAVEGALGRAGADGVAPQMPDGLETQLGTTWGGIELSGGQWQKLALGRALMRTEPLVLILDEPTASLDAMTEHALFSRFADAASATRARGGITLLVSHRFSTVRPADLVIVIDDGRVAEQGTHDDLIERGGMYAELYELQARGYRSD